MLPGESQGWDQLTAAGTPFRRAVVYPNTSPDPATVYVPATLTPGALTPLVIAAHGKGATHGNMEGTNQKRVRDAVLDRGWPLVIGNLGGDTWGNPASMLDLRNLYDYAAALWSVSGTLLFGQSMGGGVVFSAVLRATLPGVRAVAAVDPVLNYVWTSQDPALGGSIRAAWAATVETFPARVAGHDPVSGTPADYAGVYARVYLSTQDTTVPGQHHEAELVARGLTARMGEFTTVRSDGAHLAAASYQPADLMAFYDRALAAPPYTPPAELPAPLGPLMVAHWLTLTGDGELVSLTVN